MRWMCDGSSSRFTNANFNQSTRSINTWRKFSFFFRFSVWWCWFCWFYWRKNLFIKISMRSTLSQKVFEQITIYQFITLHKNISEFDISNDWFGFLLSKNASNTSQTVLFYRVHYDSRHFDSHSLSVSLIHSKHTCTHTDTRQTTNFCQIVVLTHFFSDCVAPL